MAAPAPRIGGSFAPPLTPERIARARALAAAHPAATPQVREIVEKLCTMAEVFHQTPRSPLKGVAHPSGAAINIVPLEAAEQRRIWDHVPWDTECAMYRQVAEGVQIEPARRNSEKLAAWRQACGQAISEAAFPGLALAERQKRTRVLNKAEREFHDQPAVVDAVASALFPGETRETLYAKYDAVRLQMTALNQFNPASSAPPPVPFPALESTELRDLLFHLIWYAIELEKDREPLTADMLPRAAP